MITPAQSLPFICTALLILLLLQFFHDPIREYSTQKLIKLPSTTSHSNATIDARPPNVWQTYLDGSHVKVPVPTREPRLQRKEWIIQLLTSNNESVDFTSIRTELCDKQTWDPTLVFRCSDVSQDYGEARNQLLNCLRFTLEAGAGIILPWVGKPPDEEARRTGVASLKALFDQKDFLQNLAIACPQMIVHNTMETVKLLGHVEKMPQFTFEEIDNEVSLIPVLEHASEWVQKLKVWIDSKTKPRQTETRLNKKPSIRVLEFPASTNLWPVCSDDEVILNNFGRLLNPRMDVQLLAASISYELSWRYRFANSPLDEPFGEKNYMAVQLDTYDERDYNKKQEYFFQHSDAKQFHVIYTATNDRAIMDKFYNDGFPRDVLWKPDLLTIAEKAELASLSQQAQKVVDILVMQRASSFVGLASSAEGWLVTKKRRGTMRESVCALNMDDHSEHAYSDEWSHMFGYAHEHQDLVAGIWP